MSFFVFYVMFNISGHFSFKAFTFTHKEECNQHIRLVKEQMKIADAMFEKKVSYKISDCEERKFD